MADSLSILNLTTIQGILNPPTFMAFQSATATVMATALTWTSVTFVDTAGITTDNYAGHSTSVNPSRYVIKVAGTYQISGVVAFAPNATGYRGSRLAKNGVSLLGSSSVGPTVGTGLATAYATPVIELPLAVNDYIELQGVQSTGGNLNTNIGTDLNSSLYIRYVHQ